jgi:CRISPR/Cas system CSM-associated protein Csm3 (group 7 of RAMP superfamily)
MVSDSLIDLVFGKKGNPQASLLYLTDLALTNESKRSWNSKAKPGRKLFSAKPRTAIDDKTRTNDRHMLVNIELADFTDTEIGFEMRASLYLGYFSDKRQRDDAVALLRGASSLLSGFGAFRSRGYGRGAVQVQLEGRELIVPDSLSTSFPQSCVYILTALVPMRSKFIEPGSSQFLESQAYVRAEMLRGWFVRAYNDLFENWPKPEEMATISFPDLLPLLSSGIISYPPPMSTIQVGNEAEDRLDKFDEKEKPSDQENFFDWKPKPLPRNTFITNADMPHVVRVRIEKRVRNFIDDDFKTVEGGLFVQEMVPKGITFGGTIRFAAGDLDFHNKALKVLKCLRPSINGTLFEPTMDVSSLSATGKDIGPFVIIKPLPYAESFFDLMDGSKYKVVKIGKKDALKDAVRAKGANHITLGTLRRYNTMLQRPRRNRVVIDVGSVLHSYSGDSCLDWRDFGKTLKGTTTLPRTQAVQSEANSPSTEPIITISQKDIEKWAKMSPSQIGQTRELLNPRLTGEIIRERLTERKDKYERWAAEKVAEKLVPGDLIDRILSYLPANMAGMRAFIDEVIRRIALVQWETKAEKELKKASEREGR